MKKEMRCPHCGKCIGVFTSSDEDSIAKVESKPIKKIGLKERYLESKCPRCKKLIYIHMDFED